MSDARRANIAAAIVILLAGGLSAVWVFLVPIFQAPDEPAHFDYAASIYSAGRLITLDDGTPDWIVNPYTKYLMRAADFKRIAWHSSMRVPPGYGSRPYFARVDAGAPRPPASSSFGGRISYIVPLYPFGFYALEASWMRTVSYFTGSIVAIFFAARLLCVLLLMVGLYFNYRTAINLGVPAWAGVALTAAIGLFPLTSFVSSYVQPDNLAFALVSAALFFATQLRKDPLRFYDIAALGLSLGFLAVTKYQFFLSAALPSAFLLAVRLSRTARIPGWLFGAAFFTMPTAILVSVQRWVVDRSAGAAVPTTISVSALPEAAVGGIGATLHYVTATAVTAVFDCFVAGGCAQTFWQVVGWFDTPIVIVNPAVEAALRVIIALTSVAVLVLVVFWLTCRAVRLCGVVARRHAASALRIASADPVLSAYACFVAVMLGLYVLSNNAFGAEGRQFYPFIFPAFLCFVWYAPRALRVRNRKVVTTVLAAVLLGYATLASGYALDDIHQRYYGHQLPGFVATDPRRSEISDRNAGVLWPVTPASYHVDGLTYGFSFAVGSQLDIGGLSILPESSTVPNNVAVVVDSRQPVPVLADQYLAHFAMASHNVNDGYGAFYAVIPTARLAEGAHTVAAYARRLNGSGYDTIEPVRLFFLTASDGRFSSSALRAIGRAPVIAGSMGISDTCRGTLAPPIAMPDLHAGTVLLIRGGTAASQTAVWLLSDRRPYPTRYSAAVGAFVGTIPTAGLSPGLHHVLAFAVSSGGRSSRLSESAAFRIVSGGGHNQYIASSPAACADPLRQLAATGT